LKVAVGLSYHGTPSIRLDLPTFASNHLASVIRLKDGHSRHNNHLPRDGDVPIAERGPCPEGRDLKLPDWPCQSQAASIIGAHTFDLAHKPAPRVAACAWRCCCGAKRRCRVKVLLRKLHAGNCQSRMFGPGALSRSVVAPISPAAALFIPSYAVEAACLRACSAQEHSQLLPNCQAQCFPRDSRTFPSSLLSPNCSVWREVELVLTSPCPRGPHHR
jgi:hypothetical protein